MKWTKKIVYNTTIGKRYQWKTDGFTIDVDIDKKNQGFPGSNQVNIFMVNYGGWILGTPKSFKTIGEVETFVNNSKQRIQKGDYGKRVPYLY